MDISIYSNKEELDMKRKLLALFMVISIITPMLSTTAVYADEAKAEVMGEIEPAEADPDVELMALTGTCGDNLTWVLDSAGTLTISGTGAMTDWDSNGQVPWWRIPSSEITNIVINSGVTSIGRHAFTGCSVTSINIPDSVTSIGGFAFDGCRSLTSINIPDSVTSIGDGAFYLCDSLPSIRIPNGVTSIGEREFNSCKSLTSINIPDSVTSIGDNAFYDCISLPEIRIPNSVTSIGDEAFNRCKSFTSINIPESVTSIGEQVFYACENLTSITVDSGNRYYSANNGVLFNKSQTELLVYPGKRSDFYSIPDGVTSIAGYAFNSYLDLKSISMPKSVTNIADHGFTYCSGLRDVYYGSSEAQWNEITIGSDNDYLLNATIHYAAQETIGIILESELASDGMSAKITAKYTVPDGIADYTLKIDMPDIVTDVTYTNYLPDSIDVDNKDDATNRFILVASAGDNAVLDNSVFAEVTYYFSEPPTEDLLINLLPESSLLWIDSSGGFGNLVVGSASCPMAATYTVIPAYVPPESTVRPTTVPAEPTPTVRPTAVPAEPTPTVRPTVVPAEPTPTVRPTTVPAEPTPTVRPGADPTEPTPTVRPTATPGLTPKVTPIPTNAPSMVPTDTLAPKPDSTPPPTSGTIDSVSWRVVNGELIITGKGAMPDFEPGEAPWYPLKDEIVKITIEKTITTIGSNSFYNLDKVTSVTISGAYIQINDSAFEGCTSLNGIDLPEGMTGSIGDYAFKNSGLISIVVPSGVISMGRGVFDGCTSLTEITLPFIGSRVGSENNTDTFDYIFNGNVPPTLKKVTITNETNVPENAFAGLENIEQITVNRGVSTIGRAAFDGCEMLAEFVIPDGITSIGDNTFRGCESAVTITVPDSVQSIGASVFDGCAKLKSVNIPYGVKYIYSYTFRNCASLTNIEIPDSVTSIYSGVLAGCNKLHTMKIPFVGASADPGSTIATKAGIFGYLFDETNNYNVPESVTKVEITRTDKNGYIPMEAFKNCVNIEDIIIDGGGRILDEAFANCKALRNLFIPKDVGFMGSNILAGSTCLETLVIPFIGTNENDRNSETAVLGGFFGYNDQDPDNGTLQYYNENGSYHIYMIPKTLKNVTILNQADISVGAMMECDFIEKVSIVTGKSIGRQAFYNCAALKAVSLPNNLQAIGDQAFAKCGSLETINIPVTAETIGSQVFCNAEKLKNVTIPDSVTEIADDVFEGTDLSGGGQLMAAGTITCSEGSYAQQYADKHGIETNIVSSGELDVKKTSTTVSLLSDGAYLFDVTDSHKMKGVLHVELYDISGFIMEKTRQAHDIEYRVEFTGDEMKNVTTVKIYITDETGTAVTTEDEVISEEGGDIPDISDRYIEISYHDGDIHLTGTTPVKSGTVLIQAVYNSDSSLNYVKIYPVENIENQIKVSTDFDAGTAKFMLWNGFESINPLAEAITE